MSWLTPIGINSANSRGFTFNSQSFVLDPFNPVEITWNEVISATPEEWAGFHISFVGTQYGVVHVAVGDVGSEVIIASLPQRGQLQHWSLSVPIPIPLGTRVSVGASLSTIWTLNGQLVGVPSSGVPQLPPYTKLDCGPFDLTATSTLYGRGVIVDAASVANTKGAWVEISGSAGNILNGDSISFDYEWIGFMVAPPYNPNGFSQYHLWDIALGNVGNEVTIVTDLLDYLDSGKYMRAGGILWAKAADIQGERISARQQCSSADATRRLGQLFLFGLR